ncbi:glycosyltransferase family 22 [Cordyceps militaris]|uniref:Mannosyltransferase n=1 Tax=Cordyceps militaris TaxID=73501 RepID=A0A2H4SFT2_CORMI|nr:glycosyltransferase family 22 [Cordyceps militaris]
MAPNPLDLALNALLFAVPLAHLLVAPHTKVEESFNLQAAHDILVYGTPTAGAALTSTYDHFSFPGAVPRTFTGAVVLAAASQPLIALLGFAAAQGVVRAVLAAANAACLLVFRRALDAAFGRATGRWWVALMLGQFHVMFYLGRTLPNMFSFGLTTLASAFLLPKATPALANARQKQALLLLVLSAAVFRAETALLLCSTCLMLLVRGRATLAQLIPLLAALSLGALALTVPIDSYFWQRVPLWPELAGFYYNAVLGASSDWGTSPWHYYFSSALPRVLLNPLAPPLAALALWQPATARPAADLVAPSLLFVAVYSLQPHKEARFVFYVVPALTAAAALGANYVFARRAKTTHLVVHRLFALALPLSVLASLAASAAMLLLSSLNYPGGDAVAELFRLAPASATTLGETVAVHADVLTCMTGLTLFGQNPHGLPLAHGAPSPLPPGVARPLLLFDKTEDEAALARADFWTRFDYVLVEDPGKVAGGQWRTIGVVQGYDGVEVLRPGATAGGDDDSDDVEANPQVASLRPPVLGRGLVVRNLRNLVRSITGGWYAGPRMAPRIHIMQQITAQSSPGKAAVE